MSASFSFLISVLFILGLGYSLQQTAANPLAIIMGDPASGSQRLSMAGGVNNFGTPIGRLLVRFAIFGSATVTPGVAKVASISSVKTPYLILGALFLVIAAIFKFSSLPNKIDTEQVSAEDAIIPEKLLHGSNPLKYRKLSLGCLAMFSY